MEFPDDIELSQGFKDFVSKALIKNPFKRISLEEALRHPWVQGKDAQDIQLNKDVIRYLRQFNYQSKLKKAITQCLARNMSEEPEQEVKRHFERLDKDGDNHLDVCCFCFCFVFVFVLCACLFVCLFGFVLV